MFRKLFSKNKKEPISKFDEILNQNNFLNQNLNQDSFKQLLIHLTKDASEINNPIHKKYKEETTQLIESQYPYFKEILTSYFTSQKYEEFLTQFEKNCNIKTEVPMSKMTFLIYWIQIIKKLNREINASHKQELSDRLKTFEKTFHYLVGKAEEQVKKESIERQKAYRTK